jgi:transposase-like protein
MQCPECQSTDTCKYGQLWSGRQLKQRYLCKKCGRTWLDKLLPPRDDKGRFTKVESTSNILTPVDATRN